jgi:hypothetical protein
LRANSFRASEHSSGTSSLFRRLYLIFIFNIFSHRHILALYHHEARITSSSVVLRLIVPITSNRSP